MKLMKKDTHVADIKLSYGHISEVEKVYCEDLLPVGVYNEKYNIGANKEQDADLLDRWWKNNSIPAERDGIRLGLECLGIRDTLTLKTLNRGLSLLNQYWLKESDEQISWKDVNYWDNPFSNDVGMALFNHKPLRDNSALKFSPDGSLNGALKKKWINQKGAYYLVKSGRGNANEDVFNEILVSDILSAIGMPNAMYMLEKGEREVYCKTKCFTSENTEFVPFSQLMGLCERAYVPNGEKYTELDHVYDICERFGVTGYREYLNNMLAIDYIVAGTDRHYDNIALLHDTIHDSYELSPVYGSGTCMWCDRTLSDISPFDDGDIVANPYCNKSTFGYWDQQRQFITEYPSLKKDDLKYALLRYVDSILSNSDVNETRVKNLALYCFERAYNLQQILQMRGVENGCEIVKKDIEGFGEEIEYIVLRRAFIKQTMN